MGIENIIEGVGLNEEYKPYADIKTTENKVELSLHKPYLASLELECIKIVKGLCVVINKIDYVERYTLEEHVFDIKDNILLFNYIVEGQCQIPANKDRYMFLKKNDANIYLKNNNPNAFNHVYNAYIIHILANKDQIKSNKLDGFENIERIIDKIYTATSIERHITFESNKHIQEVLNQIITTNEHTPLQTEDYNKLKALELLLLTDISKLETDTEIPTYSDAQIRVVRKIKNSLSREIASYVSLNTLSASYGINLTTLKNCFKEMYGKPLYSWYREYKFHRAKELIKNTDYPIAKIANMIGYKSSSKFSKAFKQEMGVLPSSYRKK